MLSLLKVLGLLLFLSEAIGASNRYRVIQIAKQTGNSHRKDTLRNNGAGVRDYQPKFISTGMLQSYLDYKRSKTTTTSTEAPTMTGTLTGTVSGNRNTPTGTTATTTDTGTGTGTGTGTTTGTGTGTGTDTGTDTGTGTNTGTGTGTGTNTGRAPRPWRRQNEVVKKEIIYKIITKKEEKPKKEKKQDPEVPKRIVMVTESRKYRG
ncbi:unnamed protein product [Hermetia illucens]|uniref:Uncharacterized protein n=1 Tax=Hermetia illucens TaxID=343691 RepID=A0A7R8YZX3_HERIL|nr:putative per-hexamer repeat protein 5 [Hermetia illucens]CAD7090951.1 unnamed protein product [Hermetia illucens]